jgi:WD40 repeat protein
MRPAATAILTPCPTLKGHDEEVVCISYTQNGKQMISRSLDRTVRQWDLQVFKEIEKAREVYEEGTRVIALSNDGRWVVTGDFHRGLKAREAETGVVREFEGYTGVVRVDISADNKLLAGSTRQGMTRIWELDTDSRAVASPFITSGEVDVIRFSPNSRKLAVNSGGGKCLEVWDVRTQRLDRRVGEVYRPASHSVQFPPTATLVFGTTIIAAFTFTADKDATSIYEFDASTLRTVGTPFKGHTSFICSLSLGFDRALLASASHDNTIKLWAFKSRQLLASFDAKFPDVVLSPDSRQLAYTTPDSTNIYLCNISSNPLTVEVCIHPLRSTLPAMLKFTCRLVHLQTHVPLIYSEYASHFSLVYATEPSPLLQSDAPLRPDAPHKPATRPVISFPPRSSPIMHPQQPALLRYFRKLLPLSYRMNTTPPLRDCEPRDPLDVCLVVLFPSQLT